MYQNGVISPLSSNKTWVAEERVSLAISTFLLLEIKHTTPKVERDLYRLD